jgi:hypothetical protein
VLSRSTAGFLLKYAAQIRIKQNDIHESDGCALALQLGFRSLIKVTIKGKLKVTLYINVDGPYFLMK